MTGACLTGHDAAIATFMAAASGRRLHHAWLLAGAEGIGKAMFADQAAKWLLAGAPLDFHIPDDHSAARLMSAGSHPDFRRLERLIKDKGEERARSITVDQVRGLQAMFATKASLSDQRVVIIDAVDDLERSAANALLKNLEEPPAGTTFLLVSHRPGRLLPTIRSRCRLLRFSRLDPESCAAVLRALLPDEPDIAALASIAQGAPGSALRFAGRDVSGIDNMIERLVSQGDHTGALRTQIARSLGVRNAHDRYEAFLARVPRRIAEVAKQGGSRAPERIALWHEAQRIAELAMRQSADPQLTVFELATLVASLAPENSFAKG